MVRKIYIYPEDKEMLIQKSEKVENIEEIRDLIQDMKDTLDATKTGVGISAIQLGVPKRVCLVKYNNKVYTLINPYITKKRGSVLFEEGCLSAPGVTKKVMRAQKVWCTYTDEDGRQRELDQGGLCSVIIQHELDHFDGWCPVFDAVKEDAK